MSNTGSISKKSIVTGYGNTDPREWGTARRGRQL